MAPGRRRNAEGELSDCKAEVNTLKETLALQNQGKEELARDLATTQRDLKQALARLEAATKEVQQQKQVRRAGA